MAAKRETTRLEDMAYCLLGIFDTNMPLLYGEGDKASIRLQEEICKQTNDMSIFAWTADPSDHYQCRGILAAHPSEFLRFPEMLTRGHYHPKEFTITNRGIKFDDVQPLRFKGQTLILPLVAPRYNELAIYVAQTWKGYVRLEPTELTEVNSDLLEEITPHPVYIVKNLEHGHTHSSLFAELHSWRIFFNFRAPWEVELLQAVPSNAFDYGQTSFIIGYQNDLWGLHLRVKGIHLVIVSCSSNTVFENSVEYDISCRGQGALGINNWDDLLENGLDQLWKRRRIQKSLYEYVMSHDPFC
jgi:hypothetical protein